MVAVGALAALLVPGRRRLAAGRHLVAVDLSQSAGAIGQRLRPADGRPGPVVEHGLRRHSSGRPRCGAAPEPAAGRRSPASVRRDQPRALEGHPQDVGGLRAQLGERPVAVGPHAEIDLGDGGGSVMGGHVDQERQLDRVAVGEAAALEDRPGSGRLAGQGLR